MNLRAKLLWAQAPLVATLLLAVGLTLFAARQFGAAPGAILHENFRSFEAGLTLLNAVDVIDRQGESPRAVADFERALALQQGNITEQGEAEPTAELTTAWARRDMGEVRRTVNVILRLNRDAMARKSEAARREARNLGYLVITSVLAALLLALITAAVAFRRILAPLRVLAQATRRVAFGDFDARVRLGGRDEVAALATAFNDMATHLTAYRKSSLGELLDANHRLQAVMDSLADAVIVFDMEGFPTTRNAAAVELVGEGTLPEDLAAAVEAVRAAVAHSGEPQVTEALDAAIEVPARPLPRHVLVGATPLRSADGVLQAVTVTLRDVSRVRKLEGFRGDLVATAAHELRTPLTSLHMAVHLCLEGAAGPVTPQQADLLGAAREDCERLRAVVEELLEMARLEAGTVHLERTTVGVADLLVRAAERHEARARREGTEVVVVPGDQLRTVEVDPERMRHVLDNLIDNALKHGAGPVYLSHQADATGVLLHVDDAGPGVPEAMRDQVFDKFFRVPGTPRPGTGLGLGLVRDLVVAHGGQVRVESAPSGGARFTIRLPTTPRSA
jgi:NtrC-family two-component system sensor histidine kinase KinB